MYEWHDKVMEEDVESIIDRLSEERIFSITKTAKGYQFVESCDCYFGTTLSREQFIKFIRELEQLLED